MWLVLRGCGNGEASSGTATRTPPECVCVWRAPRAGSRGYEGLVTIPGQALMRISIWIILATLLALLAITRYVQEGRHTEHICANDPTASACERWPSRFTHRRFDPCLICALG